jgi:hypothetical protein
LKYRPAAGRADFAQPIHLIKIWAGETNNQGRADEPRAACYLVAKMTGAGQRRPVSGLDLVFNRGKPAVEHWLDGKTALIAATAITSAQPGTLVP